MLFPHDSSNLILNVRLATDGETPITGVSHSSSQLSVAYRKSTTGGAAWTSPALVDGTLGTYIANSWKEIGSGLYQYCPPNGAIEQYGMTVLRVNYASYQPRLDTLEFRLPSFTAPAAAITQETVDLIVSGVRAGGIGLWQIFRGDTLVIRCSDEFEQTITGLGDLTGNDDIRFGVFEKEGVNDDNQAILLVSRVNGLMRVNKVAAADSAKGSITISGAATDGTVVVRVASDVTAGLTVANRTDCVKILKSGGNDRTPRVGKTAIVPAVVVGRG